MAARRYKIFFDTRREILYLQAAIRCSIYYISTNKTPNHFLFVAKSMTCNYSSGDLFTRENIMVLAKKAQSDFGTTEPQRTNHSQYSSPVEALNLIVDSKSQPVE